MKESKKRIGNFTSSGISALMTNGKKAELFGQPALTYIEEKNMERRLGRSLSVESNAKPLSWGKFLESRAFFLLGLEYSLISQETIQHPEIEDWSGSPDGTKPNTVLDIKCPITLKSFCQFVDPFYVGGLTGIDWINAIRNGWTDKQGNEHSKHKSAEDYYWQLVSNAILTDSEYAELIIYVPYLSELDEIRESTSMVDGTDQNKLAWINFADDGDLPYLHDGGFYKNINVINFRVPDEDKKELTSRVIDASKLLIKK